MKVEKELSQVSALDLADYILEHHGPMSHLKLQKLLYYCDAYHLAYFDAPVVHETFEAWVHGPVCVEVYHELKGHSVLYSDISFDSSAGKKPTEYIKQELSSKQIEVVDDVLNTLITWKDSELESSTHNEAPWIEARKGLSPSQKSNNIISKVLMTDFYKSEILANI